MSDALKYLAILIAGLAPVSEVRGAIPLARALFTDDSRFVLATLVAVLGNLAIAPLVLYALELLERVVVRRWRLLERVYERVLRATRRKSRGVEKYGLLGLALFVAVPLPATGAWTGSLVAHILGLPRGKSLLAIEAGVLVASSLVYVATALGYELVKTLFFI